MLAKEMDEENDAAFRDYFDWLCNRDMAPIGGGSGGGGTSSTWLNTYLNAVHSTFQNGYNITTSQFSYEYNLQINSPSYNGTITFQTGMMDYYTFWSIDGGTTWHQGNYINSKPIYTTIYVQAGGGDWLQLESGLGIKVVKNSNLTPNYYQDHYQLILGVYGGKCSDYNWVQTVYHNGKLVYDGGNNGFYHFDSDKQLISFYENQIPGANYYFEDTPNAKSFYAYLTLCSKAGYNTTRNSDHWLS